jgi:hypothetical protein
MQAVAIPRAADPLVVDEAPVTLERDSHQQRRSQPAGVVDEAEVLRLRRVWEMDYQPPPPPLMYFPRLALPPYIFLVHIPRSVTPVRSNS